MTQTSYIDIQFKGKGFVPASLSEEMNLPIEPLVSAGELGKVGRYKGKPVPYGIGLLKINPTAETINEYSDVLIKNKAKLKKYNVEEIIFDVDANSRGLEQISISADLLKKLSSLNARIQFHNYHATENPLMNGNASIISSTFSKKKIDNFLSTASKSEIKYLIISLLENTGYDKISAEENIGKLSR